MTKDARAAVVTGGSGFIGRHVVRRLAERGPVVVIDSCRLGDASDTFADCPNVSVHRVDVRDRAALAGAIPDRVGPVVHLAALHYIPYCNAHPDETLDVNVGGTQEVLAALREREHERVIIASSAAVYGFADEPFDELAPLHPQGVYGESKVAAERLLEEHCRALPSVSGVAARFFNVYGPGDANPHLLPEVAACAAAGGRLTLGNLWPRRDYVHVGDVTNAIDALLALSSRSPGAPLAVNVSTGVGTSVTELVETARRVWEQELDVVSVPARRRASEGHLIGRYDRLAEITGWQPRVRLADGLRTLWSEPAVAGAVTQ